MRFRSQPLRDGTTKRRMMKIGRKTSHMDYRPLPLSLSVNTLVIPDQQSRFPAIFNSTRGNQWRESEGSGNFAIIMKRKDSTGNYWHSLMEVFSLTLTMDALQMARNPATGKAYWTVDDMDRTQVLILDDYEEGPNYDMWRLMAKKPLLRASSLPAKISIDQESIIVPFQGGANTLWQGDWEVHSCSRSASLQTYTQRVLDFYGLDTPVDSADRPLVVTYLNRTGSRQLRDLEGFTGRLQAKYPDVKVQLIELDGMPLRAQIQSIQNTDVLVGVHGADLTHAIFLPPGSTVVEIQPPTLDFKGFRNLAKLRGHQYFGTHASLDEKRKVTGDWHSDHVRFRKSRFRRLMAIAIKSQYNKFFPNIDVL